MIIELYTSSSPSNKVGKKLEPIITLTGTLKEKTSMLTPTIRVRVKGIVSEKLAQCNFMKISAFGRFYFVTDITSVNTEIWEISGRVDVLQSYAAQIKNQTALVKRQENKWNLYLNDGYFRVYQNSVVLTKSFPSGFTDNEFVLAVAGS